MRRHYDILLGCHFTWVTDHKALIHLMKQNNLSGRQARWLESIAEFDFVVQYVPGVDNVLADVLSRIYAHDHTGMVHAPLEYTYYDEDGSFSSALQSYVISIPVSIDQEGVIEPKPMVNAAPCRRRPSLAATTCKASCG